MNKKYWACLQVVHIATKNRSEINSQKNKFDIYIMIKLFKKYFFNSQLINLEIKFLVAKMTMLSTGRTNNIQYRAQLHTSEKQYYLFLEYFKYFSFSIVNRHFIIYHITSDYSLNILSIFNYIITIHSL